MRFSSGFIPTVKETPADAQLPSHQLMIRAGMVRALAAGVYLFLPLGYRIIYSLLELRRGSLDDTERTLAGGSHLDVVFNDRRYGDDRGDAFGNLLGIIHSKAI